MSEQVCLIGNGDSDEKVREKPAERIDVTGATGKRFETIMINRLEKTSTNNRVSRSALGVHSQFRS